MADSVCRDLQCSLSGALQTEAGGGFAMQYLGHYPFVGLRAPVCRDNPSRGDERLQEPLGSKQAAEQLMFAAYFLCLSALFRLSVGDFRLCRRFSS